MSASAIRRAPIPRRSSQSCARWAGDGRARGDDHGRHGGDGRCRRARGRARRARRRAGRRARPRISTSTRRGCPKRAQRGRRHARRRACAARGARSRRPPQARLSARAAFARRPRPPSAPAILRAGSNDVNRTTRALPSGVEQRAAPARRVANRRIDGVRRALGARERRASQHVVLARVRRGRAHRVAPYRVMMVSESASRRCDPVLGAPDAALDPGQRLSGRGAYACSACGRSGRGQLRHGSPPARRRICRWGGAADDARAGRPERR